MMRSKIETQQSNYQSFCFIFPRVLLLNPCIDHLYQRVLKQPNQQFLPMIQNGVLRNLSDKERSEMISIFHRTQKIRQFMKNIQTSMHEQFDQLLQSQKYVCRICKQVCYGKQIGAHYRNNKRCKYMKDRPWLEELPLDWQTDLRIFQEQLQQRQK